MIVLAIDPGTVAGWAKDVPGSFIWGHENLHPRPGESSGMKWIRFSAWLQEAAKDVALVAYEKPINFPGRSPNMVAPGLVALIESYIERERTIGHKIECFQITPSELKKFATGKGNCGKPAMVAAAKARLASQGVIAQARATVAAGQLLRAKTIGYLTDDEADALWIYWYTKERFG